MILTRKNAELSGSKRMVVLLPKLNEDGSRALWKPIKVKILL